MRGETSSDLQFCPVNKQWILFLPSNTSKFYTLHAEMSVNSYLYALRVSWSGRTHMRWDPRAVKGTCSVVASYTDVYCGSLYHNGVTAVRHRSDPSPSVCMTWCDSQVSQESLNQPRTHFQTRTHTHITSMNSTLQHNLTVQQGWNEGKTPRPPLPPPLLAPVHVSWPNPTAVLSHRLKSARSTDLQMGAAARACHPTLYVGNFQRIVKKVYASGQPWHRKGQNSMPPGGILSQKSVCNCVLIKIRSVNEYKAKCGCKTQDR